MGLLSALMSSGDSFLNIISISTARDFLGWKRKEKSKKALHRNIRSIRVFFGILAMFMALVFPNIVDLMVVGISMIVIYTPISLIALSSKNPYDYRKVAFVSIVLAFITNLSFFLLGVFLPNQFNARSSFIPAFLIAVISALIGIWLVKKGHKKSPSSIE